MRSLKQGVRVRLWQPCGPTHLLGRPDCRHKSIKKPLSGQGRPTRRRNGVLLVRLKLNRERQIIAQSQKGPEQVSIKLSKSHKDHRPDELVVLTARVNKVADKADGEPWWSHGEHGAPTTHQPSPLLPFPHESSNHAKRDILRGSSIATITASMRSIDPYI